MENVKLKVKLGQNYRGDRGVRYKALVDFNGKTSQEFIEHFTKAPMKVEGKEMKPSEVLHFFERRGRVEFVPVAAK